MKKNKIKEMMQQGKTVVNGWLQIPSTVSAEVMSHENWDALTIDLQHGLISYETALAMLQTISSSEKTPLVRVNWNEPGQIMKILDAGSYGIICPMINNKKEAEKFVQACLYPPKGYRSFGPIRGLLYGGSDYSKYSNDEILKLAMIETKDSLVNLDEILSVSGLDGIYVGPSDLGLALGEDPGFDKNKSTKTFSEICKILEKAKKHKKFAGIHTGSAEYALEMLELGFNYVSIGSDYRSISAHSKSIINKIKN
tara:strand:+ start:171 stop:932 length:762 start_codon:yes stop_codon:yes gene_type:complete